LRPKRTDARERLGVSLSSLKAKRILAARAGRVPELANALASGRIGYEAAYLLSRVVTPSTVEDWLGRAEQRTVKHLREEVEAAELMIRMGRGRDQRPLDEQTLEAVFELERSIVSGDFWEGRAGDSPAGDCARAMAGAEGQMSGAVSARGSAKAQRDRRRFGRVTFAMDREREDARVLSRARAGVRAGEHAGLSRAGELSALPERKLWSDLAAGVATRRLTESGAEPEYFEVYRRDRFRCASPVCARRDVTPHHLVFRSHGGGDEDENVASLCVWCHLHGVHEGRILAEPPASRIHWRIGRGGTLEVDGRTLVSRRGAERGAAAARA